MDGDIKGKMAPWPAGAPTPDDKADPNVEPANELFLVINGWILLHELAHLELNHNFSPSIGPEESIKQEREADDWASHWILDNWKQFKNEEPVFVKRTLGISFALSAFTGMEYYEESKIPRTHPKSHDRLLHFLDKFVGLEDPKTAKKSEVAWYAATAILSGHLLNTCESYDPKKAHNTFRDFILYAGSLQD